MPNFPVMRIKYTPHENEVEIGLIDLLNSISFGVSGSGTVTSVSVVSANGVSGSVNNPTTTPAITLDLGDISPSSVTTTLVTGLASPVNPTDAVNKAYADTIAAGLTFIPPGARVATTAALTATYANGTLGVGATLTNSTTQAAITIDGVALSAADVVLVKNQAAPAQNGIYTVTTVGTGATNWVLTRATNYDQLAEITQGSYTAVGAGTVNAATLWIMTGTTPITVGTTAITFTRLNVSGSGTVTLVDTGTGLTGGPITSTGTVSIAAGGVGTTELANLGVTTGKVADGAITYAKIQNVAAVSLLGNPTGSPAAASEITLGSGLAFSGTTLTATAASGSVTSVSVTTANGISGTVATATTTPAITISIASNSIVLAKLVNASAHTLLGNPTGSAAAPSEITLGSGLAFSGTTLQATGSGGTVTSITAGAGLSGGTITSSGTIALGAIGSGQILANTIGGSAVPSGRTLTAIIDDVLGSTQGDIIYRDSSVWSVLAPGTSGNVLGTQGGGANPRWVTPNSLLPSGTASQVLTTDGATASFSSVSLKIDQHFGAIGTASIVSTTATFDLSTHDWYTLTLDHTATTTLALSNPTVGQQFTLRLVQDGTGSCLVNWFTTINWRTGGVPTLSSAAGAVDVVTFKCISSGVYDGFGSAVSSGGTVTSVGTGTGLTGGPITTTGTISVANLGIDTAQLAASGVTLAKMANFAAVSLMGNPTGSPAAPSAITLGSGLSFSGTTLVAAGSGGTVTTVSVVTANGVSGTVATATTTPAITLTLGAITPSSVNASGTLGGSNFSGSSSGTNTGDQTITLTGAVTGSGTGSIASSFGLISNPGLLGTVSTGGTSAPSGITLTALMDPSIGSTQGDIIYRGASVWSALTPGTSGQVLKTLGASANPAWASTGLSINQHIGIITGDSDGTTITFDLSVTDWHSVTLGGNRTLALSNPTTGQQFTIVLIQDSGAPRTVTWFSGIKWPSGSAPTLSTTSGAVDVFTFKCYGSSTYYGFICGLALS